MPLSGKVAIVTGAAGGQGRVEALALAAAGANVLATDLSAALSAALPDTSNRDGDLAGSLTYQHHDVTSEDDWAGVAETCLRQWGRIDILVNNAGIYRQATMLETDAALFDLHLGVNTRGVFLGMKAVAPVMKQAGGGTIINIASGAGTKGTVGTFAYSASKWAVRGMTRSAARELAPFNIRVNAVLPGLIDTAMVANRTGKDAFIEKIPLARIGQPDDVARVVLFLATESHGYVTGAEIPVDGGYLA